MHLTDVSDTHSLASHPVKPTRPRTVYAAVAIPAPLSVTDVLPVLGWFDCFALDSDGTVF
jgi:hypothetical protein